MNEQVPEFTLLSEDGQVFSHAEIRDKIVVFDFWQTNCGSCFKKFPKLEELHEKYRLDDTVAFFAVYIPLKKENLKTREKALARIRSKYSFRILFAMDPRVAESFKILAYPTVLIINKGEGIIYRRVIDDVHKVILSLRPTRKSG